MYVGNREPSIDELLNDPIARLLMRRDAVDAEIIRSLIDDIKLRRVAVAARRPLADMVA